MDLSGLEHLIRAGGLSQARKHLSVEIQKKFPRKHASEVASYCLRLGLFEQGLRVLHPFVRPSARKPISATEPEKLEYAYLLVKIGATEEAESLLRSCAAGTSKALLVEAAIHVAHWDYAKAIPLFRSYLREKSLSPYDRIVAEINLAAACVHEEQYAKADVLLRALLHTCSVRGLDFALGRVLEIAAESFIARRDWNRAEAFLAQASRRLSQSLSFEALYVKKYGILSRYLRSRGGNGTRAEVIALQNEAAKMGSWETIRNCDRALAIVDRDLERLGKLWFGTPFSSYRDKLKEDFTTLKADPPDSFDWNPRGRKEGPVLDLLSGVWKGDKVVLKPGGIPQRLVLALTRDLYRPQRAATLHFHLHPDRHYHPERAPALVHDACYRLRRCLASGRIPLVVRETDGMFHLSATSSLRVRLHQREKTSRYGPLLMELRHRFTHDFSSGEATRALGRPLRTVIRAIEEALSAGILTRSGRSRATRYHFVK